jgi:hypothetical protein
MLHDAPPEDPNENRLLGDLAPKVLRIAGLVGVVGLAASLVLGLAFSGFRHFQHSYLTAYMTFLTITLGGVFFVPLLHLCGAAWSVSSRRVAEIIAVNVLLMAVLSLPILIPLMMGNSGLYIWNNPEIVKADVLLTKKQPYLNMPFFMIRMVAFFAIWGGLGYFFFSKSVKQDQTGDLSLSARMRSVSAPAMLLFALSVTYASFDLLMSLSPHWYSTIFGVYVYGGSVVSFLATWILVLMGLQACGRLKSSVTIEHYHDIGKFLFGFVMFWGYIGFSQYLLIWYGNLPEETSFYSVRQQGGWKVVSLLLLTCNFIIPFVGLLSRHVKRKKSSLAFWAAWLIVTHYLDMYYLVMPNLWHETKPQTVPLSLLDLTCLLGVAGCFVAGLAYFARDRSLVPVKDPLLAQSLAFQNY